MFLEGLQIGPYTLVRKLGRGGFGEVWLAERRSQFFTKRVAIKLPHDEQVNFDTIQRETTLWEEASGHPNVLPIIDADIYAGQIVIVSEYAEGGSLADGLKTAGKPSIKQAVEIIIGVLNGLDFLHSKKIIHRDIKPQNILLQGGTPRLADFGISRAMHTSTISSVVVGTDAYMAPESFDGKRNVQTDIWSVGVVLYQLLKGSLPFPQEHPSERMFAVLTKDFEPLPADIPVNLQRIVQRALAKNPNERFQSAAEMRDALYNFLVNPSSAQIAPHQQTAVLPPLAFKESSQPSNQSNFQSRPQTANQSVVTKFSGATNQTARLPDNSNNTQKSASGKRNSNIRKVIAVSAAGLILVFFMLAVVGAGLVSMLRKPPVATSNNSNHSDAAKQETPDNSSGNFSANHNSYSANSNYNSASNIANSVAASNANAASRSNANLSNMVSSTNQSSDRISDSGRSESNKSVNQNASNSNKTSSPSRPAQRTTRISNDDPEIRVLSPDPEITWSSPSVRSSTPSNTRTTSTPRPRVNTSPVTREGSVEPDMEKELLRQIMRQRQNNSNLRKP